MDQHALAFLPGSSSILAIGNDGGVHGTTNADIANQTHVDPTWFNMDTGLNTIEFYSGDISGNFANAASPQAIGGAQDNGSSSVTFTGTPTGPVLWQMGLGGDGFYSRIDPVGTGTSLRFWQGNNSGSLASLLSVTARIRMPPGVAGSPALGVATHNHSFCPTIFSMAVSRAAMTARQPVLPAAAVI